MLPLLSSEEAVHALPPNPDAAMLERLRALTNAEADAMGAEPLSTEYLPSRPIQRRLPLVGSMVA